MKLIILLIVLHGCEQSNAPVTPEIRTICIDGVVYIKFAEGDFGSDKGYGYMSPKFNRDSEVELCDIEGGIETWVN